MKKNGRVIERENQEWLERSNAELYRLRSLKTATKKRRALKRAASNPMLTKSIHSTTRERAQRTA
jgi:hypothetical protein